MLKKYDMCAKILGCDITFACVSRAFIDSVVDMAGHNLVSLAPSPYGTWSQYQNKEM